MISLNRTSYRALRNMTRAIARGDFDAAAKWSLIFDHQLAIAKRFSDLLRRRPRRKRKTAKRTAKQQPAPAQAPAATRTGPVMLDPNGFSPGGTPNWLLNQRRLERVGLQQPDHGRTARDDSRTPIRYSPPARTNRSPP